MRIQKRFLEEFNFTNTLLVLPYRLGLVRFGYLEKIQQAEFEVVTYTVFHVP